MHLQLLLFGLDEIQSQRATVAAKEAGATPVFISPSDYNKTIGSFIGLSNQGNSAQPVVIAEPVILICGTTHQQLDRVILALRAHKLGSIIKAVLTPDNAGWTIEQLLSHLQQERAAFATKRRP